MNVIECDRCGKICSQNQASNEEPIEYTQTFHTGTTLDVCPECWHEFINWKNEEIKHETN